MSNNEISNREIILDLSYISNVIYKNKTSSLDQLIQKLEIKGVSNIFEFSDFLRNSIIDKGYICLLNDKIRTVKSKSQFKVFDAFLRVRLDSHSQAKLGVNSQIGFVVEINPDKPCLTVKNFFISNLANSPQPFETQINGGEFIIMRNGNELSYEEIMRRGIINSNNIKQIKKITSNFSAVKEKWEQYINFSNDKINIERNKAILYLHLEVTEIIKIDSRYNFDKLEKYINRNISDNNMIFVRTEALQLLENYNIPYLKTYVAFAIILEKPNQSKEYFKNSSNLSLCPLTVNRNYNELETSAHDISKIYNFEYYESKDSKERADQLGVPIGRILSNNDKNQDFISYWKQKGSIFLGDTKVLQKFINFNKTLMSELIVKPLYFELDDNITKKDLERLTNKKSLQQGYFVNVNLGERTLLNRGSKTLDSIDKGMTKNPYLISYLFNTKDVRIESNPEEYEKLNFTAQLNESQKQAVVNSVNTKDIYVIQGPPGTGKTQVITEITHQLSIQNKKVLISSQNHEAIDNVITRLPKSPDINMVRLINNEPFSKNKFAPERSVLNYYRTIHSQIEEDTNLSEDRIAEAIKMKNELGSLIMLTKAEYESDETIKKIDQMMTEINSRIKELNFKIDELEQIKRDNSDLEFYVETLIRNIEQREFDVLFLSSNILKNFISEKFATKISKLYISICNDDINENDDDISKLKKIYSSLCLSEPIVSDFDNLNHSLLGYNDDKQIKNIKDQIKTYLTILTKNDSYNNTVSLLDEIVKELKNFINNRSVSNSDSEINNYLNKIKQEEIKLNECTVNRDKILSNKKNDIGKVETVIRSLKENYGLDISGSNFSLDEILNQKLQEIEDKINTIRTRKNRLSKIYNQVIDFTNSQYNFDEEEKLLEKGNFSLKMLEETKKYSDTIISKLTNIYAMTLTSANVFNFNNNDISAKIGLNAINLNDYNIDFVIIDEASKATAIEILMPLIYGKSLVLVGDYRQLPPILKLREQDVNNVNDTLDKSYIYEELYNTLDKSLFKEVIASGNSSITTMLNKQYRSHSQISDVVNMFYDNQLKTDSNVNDQKKHMLEIKNSSGKEIIKKTASVYWVDSSTDENDEIIYETNESYSTSIYNENEIKITIKMIKKLDEAVKNQQLGYKPSVAVISFYNLHVKRLRDKIKALKLKNIKVTTNTVDNFQGKEADFVIVNIVRNPKVLSQTNRGFLKKYERINVAFSRARKLLIIVGARRAVENIFVDIPTVKNPNVTNKKEIYSDIIAKISTYSNILNAKDID